jgi:surface carbohydrate biosynthesis protein
MGIKVVSLISEGNVKPEALDQFLWGWNKEKKLYVDKMLLWSERSRNIFLSKYSYLKDKLVVTGATGFDRYKLLKFKSKNDFLKENNLKYKKIVGIAGWGFDHFFGNYYEMHKDSLLKIYSYQQIEMHRKDLYKLREIYENLIKNNKDILFILRYHPGTIDFEKSEFYGLDKYKNVFISNKYKNNQYKISDIINISDLWIGYETTTALEAWLLDKPTFLINPTKINFIRDNVYKGSPIVKNFKDAQNFINEFFEIGTIKKFELFLNDRKKIIKDTIGYDDGKNHIRAAEEIIKLYNLPSKKQKYNFLLYYNALKQIMKLTLSKTILKNRWKELNYKSNFAKPYQDLYDKVINV